MDNDNRGKPDVSRDEMVEMLDSAGRAFRIGMLTYSQLRIWNAIRSVLTSTAECPEPFSDEIQDPCPTCGQDLSNVDFRKLKKDRQGVSTDKDVPPGTGPLGTAPQGEIYPPYSNKPMPGQDARGKGVESRQVGIVFKCKGCGREVEAFQKQGPSVTRGEVSKLYEKHAKIMAQPGMCLMDERDFFDALTELGIKVTD